VCVCVCVCVCLCVWAAARWLGAEACPSTVVPSSVSRGARFSCGVPCHHYLLAVYD
jgi:hypothetical protein